MRANANYDSVAETTSLCQAQSVSRTDPTAVKHVFNGRQRRFPPPSFCGHTSRLTFSLPLRLISAVSIPLATTMGTLQNT
jgi:hypothetical protein